MYCFLEEGNDDIDETRYTYRTYNNMRFALRFSVSPSPRGGVFEITSLVLYITVYAALSCNIIQVR